MNFEFDGHFPTYCKQHKRVGQNEEKQLDGDLCSICFENVDKKDIRSILIPCCQNSWFHRNCIQSYANSSGVLFKCPLCGNNTNCISQLKKLGIFFPIKDANWELEEDAYSEFAQLKHLICQKSDCQNKQKHSTKPWKFNLCAWCGDGAIHIKCFDRGNNEQFKCKECTYLLKKLEREAKYIKRKTWMSDEEVFSDDDNENQENLPIKKLKRDDKK